MRRFEGGQLANISFPMGGIGAGMVCFSGTGRLQDISINGDPGVGCNPEAFAAIAVTGPAGVCRVLEAPVPPFRYFNDLPNSGNGLYGKDYGLPRFRGGTFSSRFPFATLSLQDPAFPLQAELTGWSPFVPGDDLASGLPVAAIEYSLANPGTETLDAVFSYSCPQFCQDGGSGSLVRIRDGAVFLQDGEGQRPHDRTAFALWLDCPAAVDTAWFRGAPLSFDTLTLLWRRIESGACEDRVHPDEDPARARGVTLSARLRLGPGERRTLAVRFGWHAPYPHLRAGVGRDDAAAEASGGPVDTCSPWYTTRFRDIGEVRAYWDTHYDALREESGVFSDCFYDTSLPDVLVEAVAANLSILKTPTLLRQADGRMWGWEGCFDRYGSCPGSCTHVWAYTQSLCHLFPSLERSFRETELNEAQDGETGHQQFRIPLPIRPAVHDMHAAGDGQLGGIIKLYREWRISGDTDWLATLWPRARQSLEYCIGTWDPGREGVIRQPHHNTYDIEFWGPEPMITTYYLGALRCAAEMAEAMGEDGGPYLRIYGLGRQSLEERLFNGEYFFQEVMKTSLEGPPDLSGCNPETRAVIEAEGPKYQYGTGCLSDGVVGAWLAETTGLRDLVDEEKLVSHLRSVYRYNMRRDFQGHANPQRPGYACPHEPGLLLCSWPRGGKPILPFVYCDEVWTGVEYQAAAHMLSRGMTAEALDIVASARSRYDGTIRNPYDEYEAGHWYARAMSSYGLLFGHTGIRYDRVGRTLHVSLRNGRTFHAFLSTADGYGTVRVQDGQVRLETVRGRIEVRRIEVHA